MDYSQMDALFTDRSSGSNNGHDLSSSFVEEFRARASQRVRNASLASFAEEIESYDSIISASPLVSPDSSTTSSHPLQHSPPASVLFSDQYPSLVSPLNQVRARARCVSRALAVREAATRQRPPARVAYEATAQQLRRVPYLMGLQPGIYYGNQVPIQADLVWRRVHNLTTSSCTAC